MDVKKQLQTEEGQALFELIVFLPLLIFFSTVMYTVGNSINLSINQQKVTRRYFYFLSKGNSYLPAQADLEEWKPTYERVGMSMVGIRAKEESRTSFAPCVKFISLFSGSDDETCDEPRKGERQTSFVRIRTAYGLCGENYSKLIPGHWIAAYAEDENSQDPKSRPENCVVADN